ncbi:hypothetical protein PHLCEN_2v5950 [Hermanssonia centrifuga]|uniref:Uncharacterized protein n=1 Tax=Hermanssonia centrifuga TaxID=98765 RepID=A0A2R6P0X9_9APHY|nr:hypothetical protein PHLCEN_2v5950 [Hermanssonia centrifuga]
MAPTPVTADQSSPAVPHTPGKPISAIVLFYAALSILGLLSFFLAAYFSTKLYLRFRKTLSYFLDSFILKCNLGFAKTPFRSLSSGLHHTAQASAFSGRPSRTTRQHSIGFESSDTRQLAKDDTTSPSPSTSPTTQPLTPASSHWAAAYLHHIRNAEDYAAGIPYVIQAPSPTPTPSPISCPPVCSASVGNIEGIEPPIKIVISSASECSMEADITDILRHYSRDSAGFVARNPSWGLQCANFTGSPLGIFVEGCGDYSQWSNEDGDTFNKHLGVVSN